MPDANRITADEDLLHNEAENLLPLDDVESLGANA